MYKLRVYLHRVTSVEQYKPFGVTSYIRMKMSLTYYIVDENQITFLEGVNEIINLIP